MRTHPHMLWSVIAIGLGAGLCGCGAGAAAPAIHGGPGAVSMPAVGDTSSVAAGIQQYLREQMRINHIPSISVAVVRNGSTELLASYGTANLEWEVPATVSTAYQLASATKPLAGTALMLLVQEGKVALDSSVTRYLPEAPSEWAPITLRHLMTHSSGISDDLGPGAPRDAEEAVKRLAAKPLVFEPGSRSSYGIGGYAVVQHLIERISGTPFPEFLAERVTGPLEMVNTRFDHSSNDGPFRVADVVPRRAGIYSWDEGEQRIFWFHFGAEAYTAGGLLSSAEDLAKWAAALDSDRLLSAETQALMLSPPPGGGESPFGVGWALATYRGRPTAGHSGGPALADILRFPEEKLTIIVLANQSRMYPYLAQGVADLLLPAAAPPGDGIADAQPDLTARLEAFLLSASRGEIPEEPFTEAARAEFVGQLRSFLPPYTRSLGAPSRTTLIAERMENDLLVREYRVLYGDKPVRWRFDLDADGRIASLRPTPE